MTPKGGSGGGKKPAGGAGSGTPPPGGGKPPGGGGGAPPPPPKKSLPRRKRKNSTKTRPQRAKTNTDNMDTRRGGHSKGKHGTQVTPAQHEDRLRTGRDPSTGKIPVDKNGNPKPPPKSSSSFDNNEKHLEALGKADRDLQTQRFNSKGGYKKQVEVEVNVKDAGTSYELDASGNMVATRVHKAKAVYRLVDLS